MGWQFLILVVMTNMWKIITSEEDLPLDGEYLVFIPTHITGPFNVLHYEAEHSITQTFWLRYVSAYYVGEIPESIRDYYN